MKKRTTVRLAAAILCLVAVLCVSLGAQAEEAHEHV